jgi:hypothetical protein
MRGVLPPRAMTLTTFRVIVAETSTAIDAVRISRKMIDRPTSHRQNRWKKAWTELSKEAVWLAIVQRHAEIEQVGIRRNLRLRRRPCGNKRTKTNGLR